MNAHAEDTHDGVGWRTLVPLAAFTVAGPALGAVLLAATRDAWWPPFDGLGMAAAACIFLVATVFAAGASLVPTHAASLVAGIAFGAWEGSLLAIAGVAGAAWFCYALLKPLLGPRAHRALTRHPRTRAVHQALIVDDPRRAAGLVALIRLSPVMPFAGTNLLLAMSGIRTWIFLGASVVGLAPRIVAVAVTGAGLSELDFSRGAGIPMAVVGGIATVIALVVIPMIARRALRSALASQ